MCSIPQRGAKRNRTHSEAARWQGTVKIKPPLRVALFLVDLKGFPPQRGDKLRLPQAHGKMKTALSDGFHFGGPEGIRTLDLSDANRTLSQLSYKPVFTCVPCYYTHFPQKSKRNFCASRIIS